ncbi:MAG TPA: hypothetical protein VMY15_04495 [Candidatus Latescibacteria bacterium]|nr:hypothetical protein [Candidatus Latescibacterota bacterium]
MVFDAAAAIRLGNSLVRAAGDRQNDDLVAADPVICPEVAAPQPEQGRLEAGELFNPGLPERDGADFEIGLDVFDERDGRRRFKAFDVPGRGGAEDDNIYFPK